MLCFRVRANHLNPEGGTLQLTTGDGAKPLRSYKIRENVALGKFRVIAVEWPISGRTGTNLSYGRGWLASWRLRLRPPWKNTTGPTPVAQAPAACEIGGLQRFRG